MALFSRKEYLKRIADTKTAMDKKGIYVEEIEHSAFSDDIDDFPSATHQLVLSGYTSPIYIIDLKKVLDKLKSG